MIKTVLPFTLGYIIFPLSSLLDSVIVVKMLEIAGVYSDVAISVFGLNNAVVGTLTNLPIVASTAFSIAILPSISYSIKKDNIDNAIRKIKVIFKVALLIILPCIVLFIIFPEQIISIVFGQLNNTYINELQISSIMLRISSLGILYLTVYQLTTAILQAKDLYYKPCIALGFAVLVKIVISVILLLNTNVNFFAINIANVVCYIISAFINLYYFDKEFKIEISYRDLFVVPVVSCIVMACVIWIMMGLFSGLLSSVISSILAFIVGGIIYCWLVVGLKAVKMEELLLIKKKS